MTIIISGEREIGRARVVVNFILRLSLSINIPRLCPINDKHWYSIQLRKVTADSIFSSAHKNTHSNQSQRYKKAQTHFLR